MPSPDRVQSRPVPQASRLAAAARDWADWIDCWEAPVSRPDATPIEVFRATIGRAPVWLDAALRLRDRIVAPFGLATVGAFADRALPEEPAVGDRVGIFPVLAVHPDELILGIDDAHLDFRLSILRFAEAGEEKAAIVMVLKRHNLLGRLYMLPVGPIHRLIVRAMMRRAVADGAI